LKILFHHRIRSKDGQAVHLEEMIKALQCLGHEVRLVGPARFAEADFGGESRFLPALKRLVPGALYELLEIGYNIPAYIRLRRAWREFQPDFVYERHNLFLLAGIWLKSRTRVPFLLEVNAPLARERAEHGGLRLKRLATALEHRVWRSADVVLPVTHVLAGEIESANVAPDRIAVVPNGIDPGKFHGSEKAASETTKRLQLQDKVVLGFTGFVRDWHGLDAVIDALANPDLAKAHLLVVGDGPAIPSLKLQAAELGLSERVHFAGLVDRDRIAGIVAAFDIALQPRCVAYASPLKLFEYMAMGKAIVAPAQPNICEVLEDGQTALLFDPASMKQMVSAITRLIADAQLRATLGAGAMRAIEDRGLTWSHNAKRVVALAAGIAEARSVDKARALLEVQS
jgi:glycosyltransferase involved in cell wall biosynthesis